ncbi:alanine racemase [bacterium]|nr:alanine racemase [Candidatus Omnitrophota bacterium]MBU2528552.1 alanine racemase [bacterium]MBU3930062.1 alanine racemase [bacterium]MBU4122067.1 alanine racemase [bacterium]
MIRPTYCRIDLDRLKTNYRRISRKKPVIAVVKAGAYGHGAVEVSRALESEGVKIFAVALIEEGIELRKAGIKGSILIGGSIYPFANFKEVLKYRLTPTIASLDSGRALSQMARSPYPSHIKVDTGMNRIGFGYRGAYDNIVKLSKMKNLKIEGIYTHFPCADTDRKLTLTQAENFRELIKKLKASGISPKVLHASNTAAQTFMRNTFTHFRPGLGLYGLKPFPSYSGVLPVMSFLSRIVYIRKIKRGERVSYGGDWKARRDSVIATLPAGYADGIRRELSKGGEVLIRGRRFPIAGRVCMDMTMIDVTDLPSVGIGDEAVFMGGQGKEEISASQIADLAGTINYEICCGISSRVPRVYTNL